MTANIVRALSCLEAALEVANRMGDDGRLAKGEAERQAADMLAAMKQARQALGVDRLAPSLSSCCACLDRATSAKVNRAQAIVSTAAYLQEPLAQMVADLDARRPRDASRAPADNLQALIATGLVARASDLLRP